MSSRSAPRAIHGVEEESDAGLSNALCAPHWLRLENRRPGQSAGALKLCSLQPQNVASAPVQARDAATQVPG